MQLMAASVGALSAQGFVAVGSWPAEASGSPVTLWVRQPGGKCHSNVSRHFNQQVCGARVSLNPVCACVCVCVWRGMQHCQATVLVREAATRLSEGVGGCALMCSTLRGAVLQAASPC
jgi:hypothetical protein